MHNRNRKYVNQMHKNDQLLNLYTLWYKTFYESEKDVEIDILKAW